MRLLFTTTILHKNLLLMACLSLMLTSLHAFALGEPSYVETRFKRGYFPLVGDKVRAQLFVDSADYPGVIRSTKMLQSDIERVTGQQLELVQDVTQLGRTVVRIGSIGKSPVIDQLIAEGKVEAGNITDQWDAYHIELVRNPQPGVSRAVVIAGSNRRGTSYGIFDLSEQIGVSPWYWWADVPVKQQERLYIAKGTFKQDAPKVKYRGIFLNDEAPALTGWVTENYGDYNSEFYQKVFELLLRLKANFLWPAMWNNAFADDDPQNMILADEYGIVMSTSHHEPMMRADKEWNRYGKGPWEYSTNPKNLYDFWTEGAKR